jgi:hypothetical protein
MQQVRAVVRQPLNEATGGTEGGRHVGRLTLQLLLHSHHSCLRLAQVHLQLTAQEAAGMLID